jgi:hypothetical protein
MQELIVIAYGDVREGRGRRKGVLADIELGKGLRSFARHYCKICMRG